MKARLNWWTALALTFCVSASAQNALLNAEFDSGLTPWKPVGSSGSAVADNANGSPAAGSAYLTVNDPGNSGITYNIEQCVAAAPNVSYTFSGRALVDASSTATGAGMFVIGRFYASRNCSGVQLSSDIANVGITSPGTPLPYFNYSLTLTSPATARSFKFIADAQAPGISAGNAKGWVDHVSLTSPEALFINSFDVPVP
jgi:hypothetical protein